MTDHNESIRPRLETLLAEPVEQAKIRSQTAFDDEVKDYGNQFVLFGAGNMGRRILSRLRQDGIEPLAFADNNQQNWGKAIDGTAVLSPDEAAQRYGQRAVFIVTIYNHSHSFPETRDHLVNLGCAKVVSVIPLRWKYHETFLPYFRDDLPHKVLLQADSIREAFDLWSDEVSRHEFVAQVEWRLLGNFDVLSPPYKTLSYFPQDELFHLAGDEFFVDAGAYDGDTIVQFLNLQQNRFNHILALEPDPSNFQKLSAYVAGLDENIRTKIDIKPVATGAAPGRLRFSSGEGTSSAVSQTGSIEVECHRLDDLLEGKCPTYIKMDIEGAELDTIQGARRILSEQRPLVAACVYHVQDHLWKIPLSIHESYPGYHFFLRPYMTECWETVCYALTPERLL